MNKIIIISILVIFMHQLNGQYASGKTLPDPEAQLVTDLNDWSYKLSSTININDLKEHLFTLASDDFEGRETGTKGNTKAANYLAQHFQELGLNGISNRDDHLQEVAFTFTSWDRLTLEVNNIKYKLLKDFIAFPQYSVTSKLESDEIIFLGYGIDDPSYSDYNEIDVSGKVVMVFDGEPTTKDGKSIITGTKELSPWSSDWHLKSTKAKEHGAKMLLIISNDLQSLIAQNRRALVNRVTQLGDFSQAEQSGANTIFLSSSIAKDILGAHTTEIIRKRDAISQGDQSSLNVTIPVSVKSNYKVKRNVLAGQNVVGIIEGSNKEDEVVIVSAHYDHVGKKGNDVYNGADDNASGTTTVLEIAEALMTAKRLGHGPQRTVLCLLVTGEEKGLLGSEYYVQNPIFPIENTIVDVNIDMVGRWGKDYIEQKTPYIYVIGSDRLSMELHNVNETANTKYSQLLLDYKYNDEQDPNRFYYRSDHYNFAKNGIPSIFYFNGVHDDYHRLSDTIEKIDFSLMQQRARHIFHTVWELANRKDKISLLENQTASP